MNTLSSKIQLQVIAGAVMAAATAASAAFSDGYNLEGGWVAAAVAGVVTVLTALGYLKPDKNPAPSSVDSATRDLIAAGYLTPDQKQKLVADGFLLN